MASASTSSNDLRAERVLITNELRFAVAGEDWTVPNITVMPGEWLAISPTAEGVHKEAQLELARTLATMASPSLGNLYLLGHDVYAMSPHARERLRAQLGYVHAEGGLLSNRTIYENVALPYSVHRRPTPREERIQVGSVLEEFELTSVADARPHLVNGLQRWRACLARALVLDPRWLVIEGPSDWTERWAEHAGWDRLQQRRERHALSLAICSPRTIAAFEHWFEAGGGRVVHSVRAADAVAKPRQHKVLR